MGADFSSTSGAGAQRVRRVAGGSNESCCVVQVAAFDIWVSSGSLASFQKTYTEMVKRELHLELNKLAKLNKLALLDVFPEVLIQLNEDLSSGDSLVLICMAYAPTGATVRQVRTALAALKEKGTLQTQGVSKISDPVVRNPPKLSEAEYIDSLQKVVSELNYVHEMDDYELCEIKQTSEKINNPLDRWGWHSFLLLKFRPQSGAPEPEKVGRLDWGADGARFRIGPSETSVRPDEEVNTQDDAPYIPTPSGGIKRLKRTLHTLIDTQKSYCVVYYNCGHFANDLMAAGLGMYPIKTLMKCKPEVDHNMEFARAMNASIEVGSDCCSFILHMPAPDSKSVLIDLAQPSHLPTRPVPSLAEVLRWVVRDFDPASEQSLGNGSRTYTPFQNNVAFFNFFETAFADTFGPFGHGVIYKFIIQVQKEVKQIAQIGG